MGYPGSEQQNIRWLSYRNDASESVPAFGLLRVTGAAIDATTGKTKLTAAKPNSTFNRWYAVNGPDPVAAGSHGRCTLLAGPVFALCNSATPAIDEEWGFTDGQWYLTQHRPGFIIIGGVTGSGSEQRALVLPREVRRLKGKPDSSIASGASGTVSVYYRTTDSTINITGYVDWAEGATAVSVNKESWWEYFEGRWYWTGGECE